MGNDVQKLSLRRWDHPPLIGNFRRRSKPLTQLDKDDRGYMDDLPLIQGYLYWLQSSAEWQRRWCVLKANVLYRLATPSSDDVIDNFKLDVWAVKRWDSGTLHGRPFCCELIYDEFCSEFFSTDSEGELLIWLNRLERVTDGPAETTSAGLARRKTVTGATQSLHATVRRVHSADSPYVQQQQQLDRDRLWLQKQQLLEEVLRQKAALERQQRKTILARNYEKQPRPDTPSDTSSNYDIGADTDILWHLRMKKTATKLKINDLERHLEACQEKSQYEMFNRDRPTTETSLIDEINAVMTTDDLYRRLAELKLELTETERDLKEFHYKALRSGESMFLSQGNLRSYGVSKTLGCQCVYSKCDTKHEVRCGQGRICAKSCTNLAGANTHLATIDARTPHENSVQHTARQQLTRTRPTSSGLPPRRAYSLRDTYVPKPTPCTAGPTVSSGINRKPSFPLAKAPVRRHDSDSAYIVTKNNRYPLFCSGPKGDAQICQSPQEQQLMTSNPVTRTGLRPRIQGHAPLRRLADTPGLGSINHDNHHMVSPNINQKTIINDQDEKQTQNADEREYCTKGVGSYRRQNSDTRNDTITTYDSGVGTLSDSQDNRVEGQVRHRRVMVEAPQTSWLRRRSASITGHLGVLPSKLKAFMPGKTQANDKRRWTSCDSPLLSNTPATRVGGVDIEALSRKYKLGKATERYRAAGENQNIVQRGDFRRQDAVKETIVRKSNSEDCFEAAMLRGDVTRQRRAVPPGESGGHDCDVRRCCATSNGVNGLQRSTSGFVVKNNTSETRPIRRHNTVNCADFSSSANKDTPHRRVTRNVVTPWRTEVDTKSRASVCHQCGTVVSRVAERAPRPRCCTTAKDAEIPEISAEALAHIAAFEKLIDDQLGLMSAARL